MREDVCFAITQPHTEPINDLNVMRMRPYIRNEDSVKSCISTGMQWDTALNICGAVKTPVSSRSVATDAATTTV